MNYINLKEARSLTYDAFILFKCDIIRFILIRPNIYSSLGSNSIQGYMHDESYFNKEKFMWAGVNLKVPCFLVQFILIL